MVDNNIIMNNLQNIEQEINNVVEKLYKYTEEIKNDCQIMDKLNYNNLDKVLLSAKLQDIGTKLEDINEVSSSQSLKINNFILQYLGSEDMITDLNQESEEDDYER